MWSILSEKPLKTRFKILTVCTKLTVAVGECVLRVDGKVGLKIAFDVCVCVCVCVCELIQCHFGFVSRSSVTVRSTIYQHGMCV